MTEDILADALHLEGIDDEAIERVRAYMAERNFYVTENWLARKQREKATWKAAEEKAKAQTFAKSMPYSGAIIDCQATVWSQGRGATSHRCQKRARFVARRTERPHGDDVMDGRLALCRIHSADARSHRHHGHWNHEVCALEPVEPEYQP